MYAVAVCNFGQDWEVAQIQSRTQYRAGLRQGINASIGVKIGLRSMNVTLKGWSRSLGGSRRF